MKLKLAEIKPNPDNPRLIKDDKYKKLVQSLKDFPEMADIREIVLNKDHVILGGNMRFKAMQEAGWTEAPVKIVDLPEDKQKEFIVKDNNPYGEWDWDILANQYELEDLDAWGIELPNGIGEEEVVEDEAPPVADVAVSKLGEVYQLGRHRLMCGDSTDFGQVSDLMDGKQADMVFTDPPYGVDYDGTHLSSGTYFGKGQRESEKLSGDTVDIYKDAMPIISDILKDDKSCAYVCFAGARGLDIYQALTDTDLKVRALIIWNKNHAQFGSMGSQYKQKHEPILYLYKKTTKWNGANNEVTVWDIDRQSKNEHHLTEKPVALPARAIGNSSDKDDIVLDLFGGSGSTLIACEQLDRTCYMMELDPKYCDVIRKRYWKFTHNNNEEGWEDGTAKID